jgi:hypothetical protein
MGADADPLREPRSLDQRRRALLEADDGVARLERQPVPVSLDQGQRQLPTHERAKTMREPELLEGLSG